MTGDTGFGEAAKLPGLAGAHYLLAINGLEHVLQQKHQVKRVHRRGNKSKVGQCVLDEEFIQNSVAAIKVPNLVSAGDERRVGKNQCASKTEG